MRRVQREACRGLFWAGITLIPLLGILASGCSREAFASEELGFSVQFPTRPVEQSRTRQTPLGPIKMRLFVSERGGSAYMVATANYPEEIFDYLTVEEILDTTDDEASAQPNTRVTKFKPTSLGDIPGRAITVETSRGGDDVIVEMRAYLVGSRLYSVGVSTTRRRGLEERARAFFETLELRK